MNTAGPGLAFLNQQPAPAAPPHPTRGLRASHAGARSLKPPSRSLGTTRPSSSPQGAAAALLPDHPSNTSPTPPFAAKTGSNRLPGGGVATRPQRLPAAPATTATRSTGNHLPSWTLSSMCSPPGSPAHTTAEEPAGAQDPGDTQLLGSSGRTAPQPLIITIPGLPPSRPERARTVSLAVGLSGSHSGSLQTWQRPRRGVRGNTHPHGPPPRRPGGGDTPETGGEDPRDAGPG